MHEHLVEGFRVTAAPHEVAWTAENGQFFFVDDHAAVQVQVAEKYESAVDKKKSNSSSGWSSSSWLTEKTFQFDMFKKFQNNHINLVKL